MLVFGFRKGFFHEEFKCRIVLVIQWGPKILGPAVNGLNLFVYIARNSILFGRSYDLSYILSDERLISPVRQYLCTPTTYNVLTLQISKGRTVKTMYAILTLFN